MSTSAFQWTDYVHGYFGVSANEELVRKHQCISHVLPDHTPKPPWISLQLSPPSEHERLEAALFLREWAKDKIPPDELRLLLPTL